LILKAHMVVLIGDYSILLRPTITNRGKELYGNGIETINFMTVGMLILKMESRKRLEVV
jgi:hypothetical protein